MKYLALVLIAVWSAGCALTKVLMKRCERLGKDIYQCEKM